MKIAVDIDDTMVGYIPKLVEHIKEHDLIVVTNRANRIREKTLTFLDAIFTDCFSDAIFAREDYTDKTKGDICTDIGATCLIEDVGDICEDASRKIDTVLMMGQPWNRDVQDTDTLHRIKDWKEVQERLSV